MNYTIPDELAPVHADAVGHYPQLASEAPEEHRPFGFQRWEWGCSACDARRLHVVGQLPDEGWVHLLQPPSQICVNHLDSAGVRRTVRRESPDLLEVVVSQEYWVNDEPFVDGEAPDGFLVRGSYLLDALDFLVGDEDGEVSVWYAQGVFELLREPIEVEAVECGPGAPTNIVRPTPRRRCFIAGYLGRQWDLPLDQEPLIHGLGRIHGWQWSSPSGPEGETTHDSLAKLIAESFPSPLAWSWRLREDASPSATAQSKALFRSFENVLAYLGSLALALVEPERRIEVAHALNKGRGELGQAQSENRSEPALTPGQLWSGGINPGQWLELVRACAPVLAKQNDDLPKNLAGSLNAKKGGRAYKLLDELLARDNKFKHHGGFESDEAAARENPGLFSQLRDIYESVRYLSDHPLRVIEDSDVDDKKNCFVYQSRIYRGDRPALKRVEWYEPVKKFVVLVEVSQMKWVSVFPFIQRHYCEQCGGVELFYLEKLLKGGKGRVKSFWRGHELEVDGLASDVEEWFQAGARRPLGT